MGRGRVLGLGVAVLVGTAVGTAALLEYERYDQPGSREERFAEHKQKLLEGYDLSDARFDPDEAMAPGVAKDGIPALTGPNRTLIPRPDDRVIEVEIGSTAVAYPINILNWHEIINDEIEGVPIAVTYCPLCDSVAVFDRRLEEEDGGTVVLEFGVSGLLLNSNVVMYERTTNGLWSQVKMEAISGPHSGRTLRHLPVKVISFSDFWAAHPDGQLVSTDTGHSRDYAQNRYEGYLKNPTQEFQEFDYDDRLPPKELGLGIVAGDETIFVRASEAFGRELSVQTELGVVRVIADEAGLRVVEAPADVRTVQTFYHSFSAFHRGARIVPELDD